VKKKAQNLKPGDVVITKIGQSFVVLQHATRSSHPDFKEPRTNVYVANPENGTQGYTSFDYDSDVEVESPTLTPAQQHAEELLAYLGHARPYLRESSLAPHVDALLAKIDPPKPPTLEEALTVVSSLYHMGREVDPARLTEAGRMLDRAREAGLLAARAEVKP
jgi:hypothetical protein